ncbi:hypothetical protein NADFUDRAFT_50296 [Nadsonia fulvescens var. elongata DSM 6958]|uniref:Mak10-domain-containing protein n=1 Tax=Nadsonia fulvescens var. elongata DSM 6958 TaxID=857566 RepID=A0A1E3PM51_9ASCO|nr:hypothetical protein NADFUDRAFT_50296 [Nadsonia fulvescens var. elongata DSM 6958]
MSSHTPYADHTFKNITDEFESQVSQLGVGELVQSPAFTLFEGVSALEIGNPKMDSGMNQISLASCIEKLPSIETASGALWVIDQIFCREMAWHQGASLIQNVLSCVKVEQFLSQTNGSDALALLNSKNPQCWDDVVEAYIAATVKSISIMINLMIEGSVIEEEDIVLSKYDLSLLDTIHEKAVVELLNKSISWIKTQKDQNQQLINRLEFRLALFCILGHYTQNYQPVADKNQRPIAEDVAEALGVINASVIDAEENMFPQYDGTLFSTTIQGRISNNAPARLLVTVSTTEAFRLMKFLLEDLQYIVNVEKINNSAGLLGFLVKFAGKNEQALPFARGFLRYLTADISSLMILGESCTAWVKRDLIENTCSTPFGQYFLQETHDNPEVTTAINNFIYQAGLCYMDLICSTTNNRPRQHRLLGHAIVSWDSLQVAAETLEADLENYFPMDTIEVPDNETTSKKTSKSSKTEPAKVPAVPLSSWVYLRKLQIMIWVALLGFELDIYKPWEFSFVYWYTNYLTTIRQGHLSRAQLYLVQNLDRARQLEIDQFNNSRKSKQNKNKKKNNSKGSAIKSTATLPTTGISPSIDPVQTIPAMEMSLQLIHVLVMEADSLSQLSEANMYLTAAFDKAGLFRHPTTIGGDESTVRELQYNLRLKPFSSVGVPELPSHAEYLQSSGFSKLSPVELLLNASHMARSAKEKIEVIAKMVAGFGQVDDEVEALKRSSVGIAVSAGMLTRAYSVIDTDDRATTKELEGKMVITKGKYHKFFPVVDYKA